jgi:hypothetical protein
LHSRNPHHNFRTKWDAYRGILSKDIKLNIRLKDSDDIEKATLAFIKLLQEAAQQATPPIKPRLTLNDIPLDIKRLVAEKRKARTIWHRIHAPADKNKFNQLNLRLKVKLKEIRNQSFEEYIFGIRKESLLYQFTRRGTVFSHSFGYPSN